MDSKAKPAALNLTPESEFHLKSKIPRFQRTQSLRLKGEKLMRLRSGYGGSDGYDLNHISLTLANLRAYDGKGRRIQAEEGLTASTPSSTSTLTKNGKATARKHVDCQKLNSPSEYGSLPPTPSPDAEDADSVKSFRSFCSAVSLDTYKQSSASRSKKFVVHCPSHHHEEEEYLTPTQRKDRRIRHLKAMLVKAKHELDAKDAEIVQLSKEVMDLRVLQSGAQKSVSGPGEETGAAVQLNDVFKSTRDSGHFELTDGRAATSYGDGPFVSSSCKDEATNTVIGTSEEAGFEGRRFQNQEIRDTKFAAWTGAESVLGELHQRKLEEFNRHHANEFQELKEKHNDRIENLLQKLSESNTRYFDLWPKYDRAQERIRQLEKQLKAVENELSEQDKRHHQMYLKMYRKGQEAARFEHADEVLEFAHQAPTRVSVPEVLQQLQVTEHELERVKALYRHEIYKRTDSIDKDAEITLRFLKDAIYHFLTNKDSRDHLRAIESIMGYSESERNNIERNVYSRTKF